MYRDGDSVKKRRQPKSRPMGNSGLTPHRAQHEQPRKGFLETSHGPEGPAACGDAARHRNPEWAHAEDLVIDLIGCSCPGSAHCLAHLGRPRRTYSDHDPHHVRLLLRIHPQSPVNCGTRQPIRRHVSDKAPPVEADSPLGHPSPSVSCCLNNHQLPLRSARQSLPTGAVGISQPLNGHRTTPLPFPRWHGGPRARPCIRQGSPDGLARDQPRPGMLVSHTSHTCPLLPILPAAKVRVGFGQRC